MVDYTEILKQIVARDTRDATRSVGPLAVAPDATVIDTTTMTQEQVVTTIVEKVRGSLAQ
jgi:cytidylate kinase